MVKESGTYKMKKLALFAVAILLLAGCQKNIIGDTSVEAGITTLSVSLEESRTSLGSKVDDTYPTFWSEGDCIAVNGHKSDAVEIDSQNKALATFSIQAVLDYPYAITYPHTDATTADVPKVEFMAVQEYTEGSFANGSAPMYGYVAKSGDKIVLNHLAGVLRFAIRGEEGVESVLKSLTITSSKALSGEFAVDCQSGAITPTENSKKSVVLNIAKGLTLSADRDSYLYIAVPHGVLGLCELTFTDTNGKVLKARWNGSAVKVGVVREFKSIVFRHTDVPVQLDDMYETEGEWGYEEGVTIAGYVKSGNTPLKGVVVSDGLLCTQTDERGFYSLKSDLANAKFVMVSIPSGYSAPTDKNGLPIFYHRITDGERSENLCEVDFSFNKIKNNADRYTLLVGADPQPRASTAGYDNNAYHSLDCCEDLYRDMREKAATITDRNVYGLMLGDIVHENMSLYTNYLDGLQSLGFPMFNIIGNHDNDPTAANDTEGRRVFEEKLGPTYYSFNIGKLHFVVLDNLIMKLNSSKELKDYDNGLTDEVWQWLQNDLSYIDRSTTLMVAAHSPMFKKIDNTNRGGEHKDDYANLIAEFKKAHIWTGHAHNTFNYNYPESHRWRVVEEHTVARSTGELWTNEYIADGTPRGYTVVEVDGEDIEWHFKPTIYQTGSFVSTKYTSKKPSYLYRDWNYSNGVAKMKTDGTTLSEAYQMKVYKPGQYHDTYDDMIAGNAANNYVYVNVFLWDDKWEKPKYNGVEMEKLDYTTAYCLATYEIQKHYKTYGYKLKAESDYGPNNNNIHTIFRAVETRSSGSGTVTVTDRFGNNYSSTISW